MFDEFLSGGADCAWSAPGVRGKRTVRSLESVSVVSIRVFAQRKEQKGCGGSKISRSATSKESPGHH